MVVVLMELERGVPFCGRLIHMAVPCNALLGTILLVPQGSAHRRLQCCVVELTGVGTVFTVVWLTQNGPARVARALEIKSPSPWIPISST